MCARSSSSRVMKVAGLRPAQVPPAAAATRGHIASRCAIPPQVLRFFAGGFRDQTYLDWESRKQTRVLTWPLVTVFGFIAQPEAHLFLKPNVTRIAAREYGFDFHYPTASFMKDVLRASQVC
jgi:hypothetical protein